MNTGPKDSPAARSAKLRRALFASAGASVVLVVFAAAVPSAGTVALALLGLLGTADLWYLNRRLATTGRLTTQPTPAPAGAPTGGAPSRMTPRRAALIVGIAYLTFTAVGGVLGGVTPGEAPAARLRVPLRASPSRSGCCSECWLSGRSEPREQ